MDMTRKSQFKPAKTLQKLDNLTAQVNQLKKKTMMTLGNINDEDTGYQQRVLQRMIELTYPQKETEPSEEKAKDNGGQLLDKSGLPIDGIAYSQNLQHDVSYDDSAQKVGPHGTNGVNHQLAFKEHDSDAVDGLTVEDFESEGLNGQDTFVLQPAITSKKDSEGANLGLDALTS